MADKPPKEEGGFAEAMMLENGEEKTRRLEKAASDLRAEMEKDAEQIRVLIAAQPPTSLLGYLWSQFFMGVLQHHQEGGAETGPDKDLIKKFQFVLEYVHAVWSAHEGAFAEGQLDEAKAKELLEVCERLSNTAIFYAMASSQLGRFNEFGDATPDVEFQAKSTWTLIRGHRYQVLEREFFEFALAPHEEALKKAYGIGAAEIAIGMQIIADTIRGGYSDAASTLFEGFDQSQELIAEGGLSLEAIICLLTGALLMGYFLLGQGNARAESVGRMADWANIQIGNFGKFTLVEKTEETVAHYLPRQIDEATLQYDDLITGDDCIINQRLVCFSRQTVLAEPGRWINNLSRCGKVSFQAFGHKRVDAISKLRTRFSDRENISFIGKIQSRFAPGILVRNENVYWVTNLWFGGKTGISGAYPSSLGLSNGLFGLCGLLGCDLRLFNGSFGGLLSGIGLFFDGSINSDHLYYLPTDSNDGAKDQSYRYPFSKFLSAIFALLFFAIGNAFILYGVNKS